MIDALPLLLGPEGYQISRSVRLRASANAYLQRTNATTGTDPLKFTVSGWVKKGNTTELPLLGSATGTAAFDFLGFWTGDTFTFRIRNSSTVDVVQLISTAVFRDYSAWYHLVAVYDSANATSTERVKLYVNGVQLTSFSTATYPPLNQGLTGTFLTNMQIGRTNTNSTNQNYGDGYLTEINFIDGQALTPSSFGETDAVTGVWKPKKYTGTYGTNGFYLNFSDNSAATAAAIGKDSSGNGNNWTPNNISVTAGVTYDSMLDVPTPWADGGNGRGNYCTGNPLLTYNGGGGAAMALKNGNLDFERGGAGWAMAGSTIAVSTGKWYWEATFAKTGSGDGALGIHKTNTSLFQIVGYSGDPDGYAYNAAGNKQNNSTGSAYGASYTNGDVIGVALDLDAGTLTFYKNNVSQGTAFSSLSGEFFAAFCSDNGTGTGYFRANFGQRPFSYTPPTGFKALNTQNLPDATIPNGSKNFDVSLWTGDQAARTITNNGSFQPDLVWTKSRSAVESHRLHDSVRGGNGTVLYELNSNETSAEGTDTLVSGLTSNGFTIASGANSPNVTGRTYVGWQWKGGGAAVTNTAGSISSQVSANPTAGFSVVTWTGTGAAATVGHGLGVAPAMIIWKYRSAVSNWAVGHKMMNGGVNPWNYWQQLETTAAQAASAGPFNNTAPTSSVFSVGTFNASATTLVADCFSEVAGYSKFGSYTGNGSADGPFVFCGFRPRYVLFKRTDSATGGDWSIYDSSRNTYNACNTELYPANSSGDETAGGASMDLLSNGFKIRNSRPGINASGGTYIFAAFAENPFKLSLAR